MKLSDMVRKAGVVGAGGAGFPTHVKLAAHVDTVIANAAECEPLLSSDKVLMTLEMDKVMQGLRLVKRAVGAKRAVFATKRPYKRVIELAEQAAAGDIEIAKIDDFYPAGDEQVLVYEVTGRVVPEAGIPLDVGVVVQNVGTLKAIVDATQDKPFIRRYVTITGQVDRPGVYELAVGTPIWWAVSLAGANEDMLVINGGPMMGRVVTDTQEGIAKTTSGLICLPRDHELARRYQRDLSHWVKIALSACTQCRRCTDLCPRHLLGHELEPHKAMRTVAGGEFIPSETVIDAFLCSQCGVCELYACPMELSPRQIYGQLKQELASRGLKYPKTGDKPTVLQEYQWTKVPKHRIMERLDIEQFDRPLSLVRTKRTPPVLNISLKQHVGAPAKPVVGRGQRVNTGDLIAEIPAGALGARVHAPLSGIVSFVDEQRIVLEVGSGI